MFACPNWFGLKLAYYIMVELVAEEACSSHGIQEAKSEKDWN
jgi:hypothetical protein